MKLFSFPKPNIKIPRPNFSKILGIFRIFKKPVVLTVLISVLISLFIGSLSGFFLAQYWFKLEFQKANLFLGTSSSNEETNTVKIAKSIPEVVREASPAVVSVIVSKYVPVLERYYYNPLGENSPFNIRIPGIREKGKELQEVGGGSGFIVSSDGLIVTNKHVVLDEEAEYTVLTNDGNKYPAKVLARDPIQDIAILKIEGLNFLPIKLGNSDSLEIGQTVIAIGNALGEFRNTVSAGVISGLLRTITASGGGITEQLEGLIQTDAAINKGNSGGPLLNLYGEVIGINTAIAVEAENIGFAIPVNKIKKAISDVKTKGKIVYPFLGVRYVLITKALAQENSLPVDYGAWIIKGDAGEPAITPDSAADKVGLKENDIILEINGVKIDQDNTLSKIILKFQPGDGISLKILREGKELTVGVILGEWQ